MGRERSPSRAWLVYILDNGRVTYTGITTNVALRLAVHNMGTGAKFTRGRGPWRVIHVEGYYTKSEALRRECAVKKLSRTSKLATANRRACPPNAGSP